MGKDGQGIARPISILSQKDTEGVGFKTSLFEPWWDNLYDKVAVKIEVKGKDSVGEVVGIDGRLRLERKKAKQHKLKGDSIHTDNRVKNSKKCDKIVRKIHNLKEESRTSRKKSKTIL